MATHGWETFDSFAESDLLIKTVEGKTFRIDPADVSDVSLWLHRDRLRIEAEVTAEPKVVLHRIGEGDRIRAVEV